MKKIFALMLIGALFVSIFAACGDVPAESTAESTTETAPIVTTAETTTVAETTTEEILTTAAATTTREDTTSEVVTTESTDETYETYETIPDQFERLMEYPRGGYYEEKSDITRFNFDDYCAIRFRVLGYDDTYLGRVASIYFIQIVDAYGIDTFDSQKIYRMGYRGKLDEQLYGIPPLEPGKEYVRYYTPAELEDELLQMSLTMPVVDDVDGNTYVYGYGIDFSVFECAIEITDPEENQIYKEGKHDKIISYLKKIEKDLPTFDYKCEIYAFLRELGISVDSF